MAQGFRAGAATGREKLRDNNCDRLVFTPGEHLILKRSYQIAGC